MGGAASPPLAMLSEVQGWGVTPAKSAIMKTKTAALPLRKHLPPFFLAWRERLRQENRTTMRQFTKYFENVASLESSIMELPLRVKFYQPIAWNRKWQMQRRRWRKMLQGR